MGKYRTLGIDDPCVCGSPDPTHGGKFQPPFWVFGLAPLGKLTWQGGKLPFLFIGDTSISSKWFRFPAIVMLTRVCKLATSDLDDFETKSKAQRGEWQRARYIMKGVSKGSR